MKAARFRFTLFAATSTCTYLLVSISISIPILISILAATIDATLTGGFALPPAFVVFGSSRITHNQQHQHRHQQPILARRTPLVLFASEQADNNLAENSNNGNGAGEISFFDEASVYVRAGSGGQGSSTYKKAKKGSNGIPDGGSGGDGGNVILRLDPSLNTLAGLGLRPPKPNNNSNNKNDGGGASKKKDTNNSNNNNSNNNNNKTSRLIRFRADDGTDGGRMYDNGRRGEDREVLVPPGTVVKMEVPREQHQQQHDNDDPAETARKNGGKQGTGEVPEIDREREVSQELDCDLVELGTISKETPQFVVARGGRGGEGTATLKGKKKGTTRRGPGGGERGTLRLTLKIVADIALVGVPNAGKSTFLAAVTRAKPRIADYPFTTIVPNLGTWIPDTLERSRDNNNNNVNNNGLVLCDVPGLIEGASEGVGLGHAFLRHIERCRVILHLVDATSDDPVGDYAMVNDELKHYGNGSLSEKPQIVVINKIDAASLGDDTEEEQQKQKEDLAAKMKQEMGHTRLLWVSAKEKNGVDDLMIRMASYVGKMKEEDAERKQQERNEEDDAPVA